MSAQDGAGPTLVILAAGYGLECAVAARTGRRVLR